MDKVASRCLRDMRIIKKGRHKGATCVDAAPSCDARPPMTLLDADILGLIFQCLIDPVFPNDFGNLALTCKWLWRCVPCRSAKDLKRVRRELLLVPAKAKSALAHFLRRRTSIIIMYPQTNESLPSESPGLAAFIRHVLSNAFLMEHVQHVQLHGCQINTLTRDLAVAISRMRELLTLSINTSSIEGLHLLTNAVAKLPRLSFFYLTRCRYSSANALANLKQELSGSDLITVIDL